LTNLGSRITLTKNGYLPGSDNVRTHYKRKGYKGGKGKKGGEATSGGINNRWEWKEQRSPSVNTKGILPSHTWGQLSEGQDLMNAIDRRIQKEGKKKCGDKSGMET